MYELNLGTFNSIFGFPPSMDLSHRQVPREFNPNTFWGGLSGVLGTVPVHQNVQILEIPALEQLSVFWLILFCSG